jgi:hypothetical protein
MRKLSVLALLSGIVIFLVQCSHVDELARNPKRSEAGGKESHNFMQDCMTCHNDSNNEASGVEGGWWNIAGSVNDSDDDGPAKTGKVELWSQVDRQGTLYATIEIDDLGNFYTNQIIDYNGVCYPVLVAPNGDWSGMGEPFTSGGCNSCHNDDTASKLELPE